MAYATSIYSRTLTSDEWDALEAQYPALVQGPPMVIPMLVMFASRVSIPQVALAVLEDFIKNVKTCDCWHCAALKNRENLTIYDVWLKEMLNCNGTMKVQLS